MTIKTILLSGAVALACVAGATAQTAKDYARYSTYNAPRAQGQNANGLRIFILGGLKSHGPGAHDYPYFMDSWSKMLTAHGAVVDGSFSFPSQEQLEKADVVIIYRGDAGYMTPEQRARLQADLRLAESYLAEVRALKPALPTMAFERTMKLYRRDREIHLLYLGRAHTEGDVFVHLPTERTVITGDAVIGWTPFMGDGYPEDWVTTLDRLAELDFDTIIMGHGEPAGRDWLRTFRGYVHDMVEAVREEVATGATLDEVKQRVPPRLAPTYEKAFATYEHYRPWRAGLLANIERTYALVS